MHSIPYASVNTDRCMSGAFPIPLPPVLMAHHQPHFAQDSISSLISGQLNHRPMMIIIIIISLFADVITTHLKIKIQTNNEMVKSIKIKS